MPRGSDNRSSLATNLTEARAEASGYWRAKQVNGVRYAELGLHCLPTSTLTSVAPPARQAEIHVNVVSLRLMYRSIDDTEPQPNLCASMDTSAGPRLLFDDMGLRTWFPYFVGLKSRIA
jgi:hypothetical protein